MIAAIISHPKAASATRSPALSLEKGNGVPAGSISEALLDVPMTAHILGGCTFGRNADEGVIDLQCQVHNYPGLFVIDNSIIPANPGVNPSLTTTALAEYAMSCVPPKNGDIPAWRNSRSWPIKKAPAVSVDSAGASGYAAGPYSSSPLPIGTRMSNQKRSLRLQVMAACTCLTSVYSCRPQVPSSRPMPLCL